MVSSVDLKAFLMDIHCMFQWKDYIFVSRAYWIVYSSIHLYH